MHFLDSLLPSFFLSLEEMGPLMEKRGLSERKSFSPAKKERKKENSKLKFSSKQKKAYNNITCTQIRRSKKKCHNSMIKGKGRKGFFVAARKQKKLHKNLFTGRERPS